MRSWDLGIFMKIAKTVVFREHRLCLDLLPDIFGDNHPDHMMYSCTPARAAVVFVGISGIF